MATLGGFQFVRNGIKYDYCFVESISSLCDFCDKVVVVGIETGDGTTEALYNLQERYPNLYLQIIEDAEWEAVKGKEKLAHFQNIASSQLDTDYIYLQQADEVTHEDCYPAIRYAIQAGYEGYIVTRINLWQSPDLMLNVPHHRKPCSTEVLRLAKRGSLSYDDGESMAAPANHHYLEKIRIYHYGFVRKKEVHPEKIRQMQRDIFLTTPDSKLEGMGDFEPQRWFAPEDLAPIPEQHPKIMQEWVKTRP